MRRKDRVMTVVRSPWSVVSKSVFWFALCAMLLALCLPAQAQQPKKVPRIGVLLPGSSPAKIDVMAPGGANLSASPNVRIDVAFSNERKAGRGSGQDGGSRTERGVQESGGREVSQSRSSIGGGDSASFGNIELVSLSLGEAIW
jgi:hypothetical protein